LIRALGLVRETELTVNGALREYTAATLA